MTLNELLAKMPELEKTGYPYLVDFLNENKIPYKSSLFGETIDNSNAEKALTVYHTLLAKKREEEAAEERIAREEANRKKRAMAKMLITSGFNFDGYRITKYSGYISGDDAVSVDRGIAVLGFGGDNARDELMSSLAKIRRNALRELKEAAYELGCNAVIGVDFDYITLDPQTHNIGGGTTLQPYVFGVTANGNAVIIEKIED